MERKEFIEKVENEITEWRSRLEGLEVKGSLAKMEARDLKAEQVENLRRLLGETEETLNEFRDAGEERFAALRTSVEVAWSAFGSKYREETGE